MFRIDIEIDSNAVLTGLDALDERRRLGLPNGVMLDFSKIPRSRWVDVDEAFARQHFDRSDIQTTAVIPVYELQPGDISEDGGVTISASDDRIKELFAAHYSLEADTTC